MQTVETIASLRAIIKLWREAGDQIALVPTMGNLHNGHLKLIELAQGLANRVVTSIFVNPTQFGEGEDFDAYPRTLKSDLRELQKKDTDLLFAPAVTEIYPKDSFTRVDVVGLSQILCGESRPIHFRGVTTIVCKLLNMVQPDFAIFGEKDFQQLVVIRKMVKDLNIPVDIVGAPIVREEDGLAMSSRNNYLSIEERKRSVKLYQSLCEARDLIISGYDFRQIEFKQTSVLKEVGFKPEYFSIRQKHNLELAIEDNTDLVILAAAWLGKTRLIDNLQH